MKISDFPAPHIPSKLPLTRVINQLQQDKDFLTLCFTASAKLYEFIGYLQNLPNPSILVSALTLQESVLSSKIEGTIATVDDVVHGTGEAASEIIRNDIVEIENYVQALRYGKEDLPDRGFMLSRNFICTLHAILLTNNVRGSQKTPGQFKTEQNFIKNDLLGNSTPLPPYLTEEYIDNLTNYANHNEEFSPLLQAAILHAQFEMIHPFKDGNGRVGRLLIPLFLFMKKALPFPMFYISHYFAENDLSYKKCLFDISNAASFEEEWSAWKNWFSFFMKGVQQESSLHIETSKRIIALHDEMTHLLKRTDQYVIINYLFDHLHLEPASFIKNSPLPRTAVYSTLHTLEDAGYIVRTGSIRKSRYIFMRILDVIK